MRIAFLCFLWTFSFSAEVFSEYYTLDTRRETALLAGGAAVTILGLVLSNRIQPPDPEMLDSQKLPFWDRPAVRFRNSDVAHWSDGMLAAGLLIPLAAGLSHADHRRADAVMAAESFLCTYGLTYLFKGLFHRARPYVYRADVDAVSLSKDAAGSFFSGHTSMAFQGAVLGGMVYQTYHPNSSGARAFWIAGLTCATATGLLRVISGNHFPTDVLAGAVVGAFIGWWIPQLHKTTQSGGIPSSASRSEFRVKLQFGF